MEQDATLAEDELSRLQAALTDMMNREGNLLHTEMLGAQRFVGVVAEVKRRLLEADSVHSDLLYERAQRER